MIEHYQQLDSIFCDEVNVKEFRRVIFNTEKGKLELVFVRADEDYHWELGGEKFHLPTPELDKNLEKFLKETYASISKRR